MLNDNLRKELILESQGQQLKKLDIFKKNFSKKFINEVVLNLQYKQYMPDELIYSVLFKILINNYLVH